MIILENVVHVGDEEHQSNSQYKVNGYKMRITIILHSFLYKKALVS